MKERITFDSRTRQSQTGPVRRQRRPLSNEQKHKLWTNVVFVALILLCHLLQNTPHMFPTIVGAHCFLLLPLTVCIAMFLHNLPATMLCLFAGTLWDVSAAHLDGFNAIFFLLSGLAAGQHPRRAGHPSVCHTALALLRRPAGRRPGSRHLLHLLPAVCAVQLRLYASLLSGPAAIHAFHPRTLPEEFHGPQLRGPSLTGRSL